MLVVENFRHMPFMDKVGPVTAEVQTPLEPQLPQEQKEINISELIVKDFFIKKKRKVLKSTKQCKTEVESPKSKRNPLTPNNLEVEFSDKDTEGSHCGPGKSPKKK